jgi:protein O-mannosyl-transferase
VSSSSPSARWPRRLAPAALLLALTLATYGNVLGHGFVWDDEVLIVENPDTRDAAALPRVLLSPDEFPPYYRPLNRASYLVDYQLFGLDPRAYHAVNLALHAAAVLLLYALGRRLFARREPAFLAAALLAVHPVLCESVAFVAARNNLFALVFMLASLVLLIDAVRSERRALGWLSGLAFFLGLCSKEQAAGLLPLAALWLLLPGLSGGVGLRRAARWLAPHLLVSAVYAILRTISLGAPVGSGSVADGILGRLTKNWFSVPTYLGLVVFPRDLTIFHVDPKDVFAIGWLPLAWVAIAAALWLLLRHRSAALTLGLLWLGLNFLPIANIIPIPSALVAERFFYVPSVGLWLVAGHLLERALARWPDWGRHLALGLAAAAILALGVRAAVRSRDWRDDQVLAESAARLEPGSVPARFNLGVVLKDRGDLEGARREWEAVLNIEPGDPGALTQVGTLLAVRGDLAEAERHLRAALRASPPPPLAIFNLALLCERTGRTTEATEHYRAFLASPRPSRELAEYQVRARQRLMALDAEH